MIAALAVAAAVALPLATLQVVAIDGPAMIVQVRDDSGGRTLAIDCVDRCPGPPHFAEPYGETPLGLFQPFDREPIIIAVGSGGSAYRVRAYRLTAMAVTPVLDIASRAAPGFGMAADGAITVTATERPAKGGPGSERRVTWAWRGGRFTRLAGQP